MFARVTTYEGIDAGLFSRMEQWLAEQERSPWDQLPGYRGAMTLLDRATGRLVGIGLYDSEANVREADALLRAMAANPPAEAPAGLEVLISKLTTVDIYEVVQSEGVLGVDD